MMLNNVQMERLSIDYLILILSWQLNTDTLTSLGAADVVSMYMDSWGIGNQKRWDFGNLLQYTYSR